MEDSESDLDSIFDLSEDEKEESAAIASEPSPKKLVGARHMNQMKEILELDKFQRKKEAKIRKRKARKERKRQGAGAGVVETLASKKLGLVQPEIVSYVDYYRKLKKPKVEVSTNSQKTVAGDGGSQVEMTMDKARLPMFM